MLAVALRIPIGTFIARELLTRAGEAAPFFDGLTTMISLVAQYLLGRKRVENWILWTELIPDAG